MIKLNQIRQGDTFTISLSELMRVNKKMASKLKGRLPKNKLEIKPDNGRVILAYGEVTGHAHAITITNKTQPEARLWSADAERFLQSLKEAPLKHEEHTQVFIAKDNYLTTIQTEYTPQGLRQTRD